MLARLRSIQLDFGITATGVDQGFYEQADTGESVMRIITADLINKMNSTEGQAEEFDVFWDRTLDQLEENNKRVLDLCSASVAGFIKDKVLLNCPVFCRSTDLHTDEYAFVIGCPEKKEVLYLSYNLSDNAEIETHGGVGFDSNTASQWLYDEFHVVDNHFEHHVIFSDGISYVIPFESFYCRSTPWFNEN